MRTFILLFLSTTVVLTACNSKYEESSPESVQYTAGEIALRAKLTSDIDKKSKEVEAAISQLIEEGHITEPTLLSILRQGSDGIQGQIPELNSDTATWSVSLDADESKLASIEPDLCWDLSVSVSKNSSGVQETSNTLSYTLHSCLDKKGSEPHLQVKLLPQQIEVTFLPFIKTQSNDALHCTLKKQAATQCNAKAGVEE